MTVVSCNGILLQSQIFQCYSVSHVELVPMLLFLPSVWLVLPVELGVAVVATKNRSGTIVTADKQNQDGY